MGRQSREAEEALDERVRNVAAFPLMAGPGAITASVLLDGRAGGDPLRLGVLLGVVAAVLVLCFVVFALAARIATLLGTTASIVMSRLLGVLPAALAVQFVIYGVRTVRRANQNGISSSMSADLPVPASAGLRSRAALGPRSPKSLSDESAAPPPPRVSSMVSCELKPCSTTSVE
jgi:hypothetical protein